VESVRRIRREKGLSQQELADLAGVGQDSISAIETGKHEPHPRTLRKLAKALEIEVRSFFEEPALAGKAEAPETGPTNREVPIYDFVHKAALLQAQRNVQAMNRLSESGHQDMPIAMSPDNDTLHYLLNQPAGEVETAYIELMRHLLQLEHEYTQQEQKNAQLEQENARLQEERGQETAMRQELEIRPE
jgi:transcriptional regulator with XRE-family HTH domain